LVDALADGLIEDYREAALDGRDRAMLDFAVKLTLEPTKVERHDIESLREQGFDDTAISDIVQITAMFNYYNRLADGLGVDLEDSMPPAP
jgi:uncharacterized peroxidase-related enzyme